MRICIDPGHGGKHPGAVYFGRKEKDATLSICQFLMWELKSHGHDVVMTRTRDVTTTLAERCNVSNRYHADLFISVHLNASVDPTVHGAEVWRWHAGTGRYAVPVQRAIIAATHAKDRGVKLSRSFYVLRHTQAPALMIECGFMSNREEGDLLFSENYQALLARAIADGIETEDS